MPPPAAGRAGFYCPPRRSVADFLQEVTTPSDQHKYWDLRNPRPHRYVSPLMVEAAFKLGPAWAALDAQLAAAPPRAPGDDPALPTTKRVQEWGGGFLGEGRPAAAQWMPAGAEKAGRPHPHLAAP